MTTWGQFLEAVDTYLGYLETEFGFRKQSVARPFVIFGSNVLSISIYYDIDGVRELDLGIRKIDANPRLTFSIGIGMLQKLHGAHAGREYRISYPKNCEALREQVELLGKSLKEYGSSLLLGDLRVFDILTRKEEELAREKGQKE